MSVYSLIFIPVFHRILDFKNGAEFLFRPLFFNGKSRMEIESVEREYRIITLSLHYSYQRSGTQ